MSTSALIGPLPVPAGWPLNKGSTVRVSTHKQTRKHGKNGREKNERTNLLRPNKKENEKKKNPSRHLLRK